MRNNFYSSCKIYTNIYQTLLIWDMKSYRHNAALITCELLRRNVLLPLNNRWTWHRTQHRRSRPAHINRKDIQLHWTLNEPFDVTLSGISEDVETETACTWRRAGRVHRGSDLMSWTVIIRTHTPTHRDSQITGSYREAKDDWIHVNPSVCWVGVVTF